MGNNNCNDKTVKSQKKKKIPKISSKTKKATQTHNKIKPKNISKIEMQLYWMYIIYNNFSPQTFQCVSFRLSCCLSVCPVWQSVVSTACTTIHKPAISYYHWICFFIKKKEWFGLDCPNLINKDFDILYGVAIETSINYS